MKAGPVRLVRLDEVPPTRWRNGGGSTRELLAWPASAGSDGWACRISIAQVEQAGPFSVFAGVERWFTVLGGEGVALQWAQQRHRLTPGSAPLCFDGAEPAWCEPLDGATQDLNLMIRRSAGRGRMTAVGVDAAGDAGMDTGGAAGGRATPTLRALYCQTPVHLQVDGAADLVLGANTLAWSEHAAAAQRWRLQARTGQPRAWWLHFEARGS